MSKLKRKFTEEEISSIRHEGGIYDKEDKLIFETVHDEIIDTDTEKNSVTYQYVIKDLSNNKFYSAELGQSQWYQQDEYNAKQKWTEVKEKKKTITYYE